MDTGASSLSVFCRQSGNRQVIQEFGSIPSPTRLMFTIKIRIETMEGFHDFQRICRVLLACYFNSMEGVRVSTWYESGGQERPSFIFLVVVFRSLP